MKVTIIGTRGIPDIMGGVETHCEELYPRLAEMGYDITVVRRSCYITDNNRLESFKGVKLHDIYAPHKKSLEAIVHTFLAILYAKRSKADLIHIHAVGPSLLVPFARLLGLRTVMTHHGADYDRQKWGALAKTMLKLGERMGVRHANEVIVISKVIQNICIEKYNRLDTHLVFNGVNTPVKATSSQYIASLGLSPKKYILATGRFVKEKGFDILVRAFSRIEHSGYKLAIAGDADHPDEYSDMLKKLAAENHVVLTGFIRGEKLNEILTHAALYVLPSSHEGLPIALLEALSYNLDVTVSDIPANKLSCLQADDFHPVGNEMALTQALDNKLANLKTPRQYDLSPYNWDYIARQVNEIYARKPKISNN